MTTLGSITAEMNGPVDEEERRKYGSTTGNWDEEPNRREAFIHHLAGKYRFYVDEEDPNITIYIWTGQKWAKNVEAVVLREMTEFYNESRPKVSKEALLDYFKGYGQKTEVIAKPPYIIAFRNGIIDLRDPNQELKKHDPAYFCVNTIPHDYDREAKCPNWESFIAEVHRPEDVLFVQEWWGYNVFTAYARDCFCIFLGFGQNGKTIELKTVIFVLGEDNVTATSIQDLNYSPYAGAELHQKLANIADDIVSTKLTITGKLKTLSSGGRIQARQIYGAPFDYTNYAKITDSCNEPPEITDDSDAIWERLRVVVFPNKFVPIPDPAKGERLAKDKHELLKTLQGETSGIINWMLKGLNRFIVNDYRFSYNLSTEQVRRIYRLRANPVRSFIEERMEYTSSEGDYILKDQLYPAFQEWAKASELKSVPSRDKFFRIFKDEGIEATQKRLHEDQYTEIRPRVYLGWRFRDPQVKLQ